RLAHEADVAVVAPATANVIARLALGLADDMVTSALLEARCPLVIAPAMHTGMYEHPATREHLETLTARGAVIVGPATGSLAAGGDRRREAKEGRGPAPARPGPDARHPPRARRAQGRSRAGGVRRGDRRPRGRGPQETGVEGPGPHRGEPRGAAGHRLRQRDE